MEKFTQKSLEKLLRDIVAAGGENLALTNQWEIARFRTVYGFGVIYQNAKGRQKLNGEAGRAIAHLKDGKGSLAPVATVARFHAGKRRAAVLRVLERDGSNCFFCGDPMGDDTTIEHLIPLAHGGPNHISNLVCAHAACNLEAGHLSAAEKATMAVAKRAAKIMEKPL